MSDDSDPDCSGSPGNRAGGIRARCADSDSDDHGAARQSGRHCCCNTQRRTLRAKKMSDAPQAELSLIVRQQKEILDEIRMLRNDMSMTAAIVQQLDGTVSFLVGEIRGTYAQQSRLDRRVRELEGKP
jgi:hypothetical protein